MTSQDTSTAASPPRSLKERQREERAELILQAAETMLAEKGYHDTSMEEIAARVGIAKGTIYLHYPSKDDLVVALFEREVDTFQDMVAAIATQDVPARVRLERILRHAYEGMHGQRMQLFLSLFSSTSVRKRLIERQESLQNRMDAARVTIGAVLSEGQAAGEFDPTIPTPVMLTTFLRLISPHGYEQLQNGLSLSSEDMATYVGRIYFHGITASISEEED